MTTLVYNYGRRKLSALQPARPPKRTREFRMEAHAVRIRGLIKASEGDISVTELADRLDIDRSTVGKIVKDRGWIVRKDQGGFEAQIEPIEVTDEWV